MVGPTLQASTSWHVHNLATDASCGELKAVVVARPLSEYGDAFRERSVQVFGKRLCPFGVLQINDRHAARPKTLDYLFSAVLPTYGVYRKANKFVT